MFLREGETWSRAPRFRSARSCLCIRGGETSPPLWIPFEPCKPDEGANLTAEDEASFTFRRPSPGPFVPPALRRSLRPEELQLWGRYNSLHRADGLDQVARQRIDERRDFLSGLLGRDRFSVVRISVRARSVRVLDRNLPSVLLEERLVLRRDLVDRRVAVARDELPVADETAER